MTILQFFRIIKKHILLLIAAPLFLAILVYVFTANQPKTYESKATLYTGLASGYNVGSGISSKVDYDATQIAFDNFMSIMNSRNVKEEVALRLFATHLMLDEPDPQLISKENYRELQKIIPNEIKNLVVENDLKATVKNLREYKKAEEGNFVYELLNYVHPHYSIKAISEVEIERLNNSDLVELTYESDDPGICQLTLKILTNSFTENYKSVKANRTDEVISYFEKQLAKAEEKLNKAEDKLLKFNQDNNIINYSEQTKFIADQKEKLDVEIQRVRMERASAKAAIKKLESQLSKMDKLKLQSQAIINLRDSLANLNSKVALIETKVSAKDKTSQEKISNLNEKIAELEMKLKTKVDQLHAYSNTKEGVNKKEILSNWLNKVIKFEGIKGSLEVLLKREKEFLERYETFAPLGARLKRIERGISVSEREYLSILKSLNQARLKEQNIKLQSDVKVVSKPYFPLSPKPSKRKLLIVAAAMVGFILVLFAILAMEYFDTTLRYPDRAQRITGLPVISVLPILYGKSKNINYPYIIDRLVTTLMYHLEKTTYNTAGEEPKIILFYSNHRKEGKTTIIRYLIHKLNSYGISNYYINHENEDPTDIEEDRMSNEITINLSDLYHINSKQDLLNSLIPDIDEKPKYVFVEMSGMIAVEYPLSLPRYTDFSYLIARANRLWSEADKKTQENIIELLDKEPSMVLNGTELESAELFLGELPKKRSHLARIMKRVVRLQFYSRYKIKK